MTPPRRHSLQDWFVRRTLPAVPLTPEEVADAKRTTDATIGVCLPALDEERTIGYICNAVRTTLMGDAGVVDRLVVIDSGSKDATAEVAGEAGATVHRAADILPHLGAPRGKGEALWKSLAVIETDIVVWLDSDVTDFDPATVLRLVAPLLDDPELEMTKGFYDRPLPGGGTGGRLTEVAVRPAIQLLYPELTGVVQPLSGEYAVRRDAVAALPFAIGYGVDLCLLIDLVERFGLDALAQVDLGIRVHRNRDLLELGVAAHEILHCLLSRLEALGRLTPPSDLADVLVQFARDGDVPSARERRAVVDFRPPMASVR